MSRIARAGALLGTSAALTVALTGAAHAAPTSQTQATTCLIKVYSGKNYTGSAACISKSYKNLADYRWPNGGKMNDSISSLKVDKNCTLKLYRNASYKGTKSVWTRSKPYPGSWTNDPTLSNNAVGDNKTSSISTDCHVNV
jgi:hypothetical protein